LIRGFLKTMFLQDDQFQAILGWLSWAVRSLYNGTPGNWNPGQVLGIVGGSGIGKTSLQNKIITPLLAYRGAKAEKYLSGEEDFNAEICAAEHLILSDPDWTTRAQCNTFRSRFKAVVAEPEMIVRRMRQDPFTLPVYHRLSMSMNDDEQSLGVLPDMAESHRDKLLILDAVNPAPEFRRSSENNWDERVKQELPAFLFYLLNQHVVPEKMRHQRYGVEYQNPKWTDLLAAPTQDEVELEAEEIIDRAIMQMQVEDKETGQTTLKMIEERTVTAREVYDAVFYAGNGTKSSAEQNSILRRKSVKSLGKLLTKWADEPSDKRTFFIINARKVRANVTMFDLRILLGTGNSQRLKVPSKR
jgi:hypothetical protein